MAVPAQGPNGVYCRATLVVCPLVAVIQWRQEIARFTAPGALKVGLLRRVLHPWTMRQAASIGKTSHCSACHTPLSGPAAQLLHPCEPLGEGRYASTASAGLKVKLPDTQSIGMDICPAVLPLFTTQRSQLGTFLSLP